MEVETLIIHIEETTDGFRAECVSGFDAYRAYNVLPAVSDTAINALVAVLVHEAYNKSTQVDFQWSYSHSPHRGFYQGVRYTPVYDDDGNLCGFYGSAGL